jgi:hypothetical protein
MQPSAQLAFKIAIEFSNKYLVCPAAKDYYLIAKYLYGWHDNKYSERPIYGEIGNATMSSLNRKISTDNYIEQFRLQT